MKALTIATRRGELAVAQTQSVIAALKVKHAGIEIRIREMTTAGDRDRRTALWDLKDTGFFTSCLEDALLAGEADIAVHSFKDLPTQERAGLAVTAVCDRQWPEDCLVCRTSSTRIGWASGGSGKRQLADGPGHTETPSASSEDSACRCHPPSKGSRRVGCARQLSVEGLPRGARVGTSSLRRAAQLKSLRPDIELVPLRGNVRTRLTKLQSDDLDAIILARAGLERLGEGGAISVIFDPRQFIPAAAQGALAVQIRSDDAETVALVRAIDDPTSRALASAERQVLVTMACGCHAPAGAYAELHDGTIELHAFVSDVQGRQIIRRQVRGPASEGLQLGEQIAREVLDAGGREILQAIDDL